MSYSEKTAHNLIRMMENDETSAEAIVAEVFNNINDHESTIEAYMSLSEEQALESAKKVDEARAKGEKLGPLTGIPIAIKDVICMQGTKTTCSSRFLENFTAPYDAGVIERLKAAGVIFIGKTNMDEFAMGSSTENSFYKTTKNPWDISRIPGGSSGGSAAAVAASETILALGSDTGGSIRQPAALCGVVGMKPTYGRVSRYGLVAFASSLDQIGPFAKDVTDCSLLLNAICGYDHRDSTSLDLEVPDFTASLVKDIKGLKVGLPKEFMEEGLDPEIKTAVEKAIDD